MQYVFSLQASKTIESLEWKTDIVESEDGREQSNKVRDVPRQSFAVTAFCDNANYQETFNLLYSGMSSQWGVPTWTEAQIIPTFIGGTTIFCDPTNRDFRAGHYAILWANPQSYQLVQIASVGVDFITLEESATAATNAILMPLRIARIVGQPSRQYNGFDQFIVVNFEVEDANALATVAPAQFLGYDLNFPETEGLKDGDRAESAFESRNDLLDFGLGRTSSYHPWRHSRVTYPYAVILDGQTEKQTFREWLHRRSGRYSKFWMPTWENDIRVANWSGTQFNIFDDGISETDSIRQTIAIQTETGWHARTVSFAQTPVNGILNGVLSSSFTGTIQRVCWLGLRRLESDRVEIAHTTGGVAKVALSLVEVEPNGDDEGNLLTEAGLDISTELGQPIALESASEVSQLLNGSKKISDMVMITPATAAAAGAYMVTATEDSTNNKMLVSAVDDWIIGKHVAELDPHPQYQLKEDVADHELLSNLIGGDATGHAHLISATATKVEAYGTANSMVISDVNNYIPISQIPASLLGAVRYQGTWNASTNTPTLAQPPSATTKGYYYITSVAGTFNSVTYNISDWIISDGTAWQKIDNTDAVTSVAGRTGAVVLTKSDVGLSNVDNTSDANKPISTATQTALNAKQNQLTFDTIPTDGSSNPVTSNGVFDALATKVSVQPSIRIYSTVDAWLNGGIFFSIPKSSQFQERASCLRVFCGGGTTQSNQYTADVFVAIKVQSGVLSYRVSLYNGSGSYGRIRYRLDEDANWWYITVAAHVPAFSNVYVSVTDGAAPSSFTNQTTTEPTGLVNAPMDNVLFQSATGNYGTAETIGSKGEYAGVSVPGFKRLNLMSSVNSEIFGLFIEPPGESKWMLLRYPASSEGLTTDYPPPSNASGNQIATAAWVRGRLADTTVDNADKVDGYHIVYTTYAGKGSASDTFYFTAG